tara:strand:+ start:254 stop:364 length:111 start_codon:yes stop_codon:yes gene_type:complete
MKIKENHILQNKTSSLKKKAGKIKIKYEELMIIEVM